MKKNSTEENIPPVGTIVCRKMFVRIRLSSFHLKNNFLRNN